ncbi:unnamed protein product [Polarella glacialis]|uniref:Receptor ligand binding region domain-containing protein n=1 Tax=Polarella glacialis TaxID=89957 RepID=A0A813IND5_POLGL|nr:unnamed protein product [Polarella glacialis]
MQTSLLLLLCSLAGNAHQSNACELKLGGAISSTGKHGIHGGYGWSLVSGWTLWAETVNARGGLQLPSGKCTVRLPLDVRDDESSSSISPVVLEEILNSSHAAFADLDFVIGPASSGITMVDAQVAQRHQKILFSSGASEQLYDKGNEYIFSTLTPGRQYMSSGLELLHSKGARSVVFASQDRAFSQSVCEGANKTAASLGMEVKGYFVYSVGKSNFADLVYSIKTLDADVYAGCGHQDDVTHIIGNANVLNVNPKAMLVTSASDQGIVKNVGVQYSHGLLSPTQWHKSLDFSDDDLFFGSAAQFHETFLARFGLPPSYHAAFAAAAGYALGKAIEAAGSTGAAAVITSLRALSVNSFYGPIAFSGPGDTSGLLGTMPRRPMGTTQISNGTISVVAPQEAAAAALIYPLPTWAEKALMLYPCPEGTYDDGFSSLGQQKCTQCNPGEYRDNFALVCHPCPAGEFAKSPGARICQKCPATQFQSQAGATACIACPAGTYCPDEGSDDASPCPVGYFCLANEAMPVPCPAGTYNSKPGAMNVSHCRPCDPGQFSADSGKAQCEACARGRYCSGIECQSCDLCPAGTFASLGNQSNCTSCGPGKLTYKQVQVHGQQEWLPAVGSDSESSCGCDRGMFANPSGDCEPCAEGMSCAGMGIIVIEQGYHNLVRRPDQVYRCFGDAMRCPGGETGSCAVGRDPTSLGCSSCLAEPPHSPGPNGTCEKCNENDSWAAVGLCVLVVLGLCAVYAVINGESRAKQKSSVLLIGVTVGQLVSVCQFFGVLYAFAVQWPEPFASLLSTLMLLNFQIEAVKIGCAIQTGPVGIFTVKMCIMLFLVLVMTLIHAFNVIMWHGSHFRKRLPALIGTAGTLCMAFFVSILSNILAPFQCDTHPGGLRTVRAYPTVVCWDPGSSSTHMEMVGISLAFATIPIAFLTVSFFVIRSFPRRMLDGDVQFQNTWVFLFFRFHPRSHRFALVLLGRNALLGISPVLPDAMTQVGLLQIILLMYLMVTLHICPWRLQAANILDVAANAGMVLMLSLCALFIDNVDRTAISQICCALFAFLLIAFSTALLHGMVSRFLGARRKAFDYFLCHHKAGAGSFARLLKIKVSARTKARVWLDSDDLKDMSLLFEYVKSHTQTVVVLCSEGIFSRPWCLGELTTAHLNGIKTVFVCFPGFAWPGEEFMNSPARYVTGLEVLTEHGLSEEMLVSTLRSLSDLPHINLPKFVTGAILNGLVDKLGSGASCGQIAASSRHSLSAQHACETIILADHSNSEAACTALILENMLHPMGMTDAKRMPKVLGADESVPAELKQVVVVCSSGCFLSPVMMRALIMAAECKATVLPVISEDSFRFPTEELYEQICSEAPKLSQKGALPLKGGYLARLVKSVFNEIAVVVQPADYSTTEQILKVKAEAIMTRLGGPLNKLAEPEMDSLKDLSGPFNTLAEPEMDSLPLLFSLSLNLSGPFNKLAEPEMDSLKDLNGPEMDSLNTCHPAFDKINESL